MKTTEMTADEIHAQVLELFKERTALQLEVRKARERIETIDTRIAQLAGWRKDILRAGM